jgi:Kelch motif
MRFGEWGTHFAAILSLSFVFACTSSSPSTPRSDGGFDAPSDSSDGAPSSRANGSLGTWQSLAPMPLPRANHCSVVAAGYLVVIGGNYAPDGGTTFVDLDAVDVAALQEDGSIGPWSQAGTTPSPVSGCTAAASGNTIFLVDGLYDDAGDQGHVFSAQLSASGVLGSFAPLGPLPDGQDAFYSAAWVASDDTATLYAIDSSLSSTTVLEVSTVPKFGAWSVSPWLSGFLGRPEYAFTGTYLYAISGYLSDDAGNPTVTAAYGASVISDGKIGKPFTTQSLPAPVTYGNGVAVDDWIFVVGGKSSPFGIGETSTFSSQVGSGGQLGPWKPQTSLPQGRTDMTLTLSGDFLYLTGGGYMGPGLATVFAARVRF